MMKKTFFIFAALFFAGCQSAIDDNGYTYDPWEAANRKVFAFNETLDSHIIRPVAVGYDTFTPAPIQAGVRNFFGNLDDIGSLANSVLQLKFEQSMQILARVLDNTFFGLGGVIEVSKYTGNEKIEEDFGKTLAHYGVKSGPFVMLPFFGPSTVRDASGRVVDSYFISPLAQVKNDKAYWSLWALDSIQTRAELLSLDKALQQENDKYRTMRDSWLQYRFGQISGQLRSAGEQEALDAIFEEQEQQQ